MSNSDEHIVKSMTESFGQIKRSAPPSSWDEISSGIALTESELSVKNSFTNVAKLAPLHSWDKIKRGVIIDEVWEGIALNNRKRKRGLFWWSAAGILVLLVGIASIINDQFEPFQSIQTNDVENSIAKQGNDKVIDKQFKKQQFQHNTTPGINDNKLSNPIISTNKNEDASTAISIPEVEKDYINDSNEFSETTTEDGAPHQLDLDKEVFTKDEESERGSELRLSPLNERELMNLISATPIENVPHQADFHHPDFEIEKKQEQKFRRFELGVISGLNNTWMLNNEVKSGFKTESLVNNQFSFGYNLGTEFYIGLNVRNAVILNYDILSVMNQNYTVFSNGRLEEVKIKLKQQKIGLLYKHNFIKNPAQKNYFVMKSGIFFSHSIETEAYSDQNLGVSAFEKVDFGLKFAAGYEHDLGRIKFEYGLQTDAGILNISRDNEYLPKKFNHSNSYMIGVYASLRYIF